MQNITKIMNTPKTNSIFYLMLGYILKDEAKDSWPGLYMDTIPFFKEFNNYLSHIQFLKLKKCWAKTYGNMANYAVTQFFQYSYMYVYNYIKRLNSSSIIQIY